MSTFPPTPPIVSISKLKAEGKFKAQGSIFYPHHGTEPIARLMARWTTPEQEGPTIATAPVEDRDGPAFTIFLRQISVTGVAGGITVVAVVIKDGTCFV